MKSGSIFQRLLILLFVSITYIVITPFIIKSSVIINIMPPTRERPFIILLICFTSILYINYALSHFGKNITDFLTEGLIVLFYFILILSFLGPQLFQVIAGYEKNFLFKKKEVYRNLYELKMLIFLEIPIVAMLIPRLTKYCNRK